MKVTIKNFQKKIPIDPKRIKRVILKVFRSEGIKKSGEITVCFVNNARIRQLNSRYLGKNCATDVLAFNSSGGEKPGYILADIIISTDAAARNAGIFKTSSLYEINLYAVHATLHLLGYDDKNNKAKIIMRQKADGILSREGIRDGHT